MSNKRASIQSALRIASFTVATSLLLLYWDTPGCVVSAATPSRTNRSTTYSAFVPPNHHQHQRAEGDSNTLPSTTSTTSTRTFYANDHNNNDNNANNKKESRRDQIMRAWNCHGRNQRDLVDRLMQAKIVKADSVRDVLYQVDRQNFAPASDSNSPYMDTPQPIGLGQTISAPHMHAHVLEEIYPFLKKSPASQVKILDVGCGSGYLTAALGRWVAPIQNNNDNNNNEENDASESPSSSGSLLDANKTGKVYGIDIYPHLVDLTTRNMEKGDNDLLTNKIVSLSVTDGWKGLPDASPFDAIHVGAAAAEFPRALLQQLKVGGVLIIPVGPEGGVQNLYRVERLSDGFTQEDFRITELLGVRYVPLVQQSPDARN